MISERDHKMLMKYEELQLLEKMMMELESKKVAHK